MAQNQQAPETAQNGFAVRDFRKARGMSVAELARAVGITDPHQRNIENEHRSASDEHLNRIAHVLDVSVASLRRRSVAHRKAVSA